MLALESISRRVELVHTGKRKAFVERVFVVVYHRHGHAGGSSCDECYAQTLADWLAIMFTSHYK